MGLQFYAILHWTHEFLWKTARLDGIHCAGALTLHEDLPSAVGMGSNLNVAGAILIEGRGSPLENV